MALIVRGTHTGQEYNLSEPVDTEIEAKAILRREERNGYYSDLHVFDLDQYQEDEYRKLPQPELERLAGIGDVVARRVMGTPVVEPTADDLDAQIATLQAQRDSLTASPEPSSSPFDTPPVKPSGKAGASRKASE